MLVNKKLIVLILMWHNAPEVGNHVFQVALITHNDCEYMVVK